MLDIADLTYRQVTNRCYLAKKPRRNQRRSPVHRAVSRYARKASSMDTIELKQWCEENIGEPTDEHQPFAIDYYLDEDAKTDAAYQVTMTTKYLMGNLGKGSCLQVDATYKLLKHPDKGMALLLGTSDVKKHFHPIFISISSNEDEDAYSRLFQSVKNINPNYEPKAIMGDGSKSITKAAKKKFPTARRLMCYFHVTKHVKEFFHGTFYQSESVAI